MRNNDAHPWVECSNRGECDRDTGQVQNCIYILRSSCSPLSYDLLVLFMILVNVIAGHLLKALLAKEMDASKYEIL